MIIPTTKTMGPSGQFISLKAGELSDIYNPAVLEPLRNLFYVEEFKLTSESYPKLLMENERVFQQRDFDCYGETLVDLTRNVVAQDAHLNLGLLRGAYRPCVMIGVMTRGAVAYDFLCYTNHSKRESEIMGELRHFLKMRDPQTEEFRIQVTDTAIGGFGSTHCAQMLAGIKTSEPGFANQTWRVTFNLLHDFRHGINVIKMDNIANLSFEKLLMTVIRYPVSNLITEDYDAGLGLFFDGKKTTALDEPGKFYIDSDKGIMFYQSDSVKLTLDEKFTQAVTEALEMSPHEQQINDIWISGAELW